MALQSSQHWSEISAQQRTSRPWTVFSGPVEFSAARGCRNRGKGQPAGRDKMQRSVWKSIFPFGGELWSQVLKWRNWWATHKVERWTVEMKKETWRTERTLDGQFLDWFFPTKARLELGRNLVVRSRETYMPKHGAHDVTGGRHGNQGG